ncbi:MAG: DUF362 domain-containing protein [candidate division KSB1 bacterium]|nr:DUF362 domain-containing protein [candidate division KSB1 bacterium]MDZ7301822.1 DUF362 domain-containing protein [candidate division KSB1 bacterium]
MSFEQRAISRRDFITNLLRLGGLSAASVGMGAWLKSRSQRPQEQFIAGRAQRVAIPPDPNFPEMVVVYGRDPRQLIQRAVAELGGITRFIAPGEVVLIKPNIAWDRTPEQAANTNPQAVGEMVRLCRSAGAKTVIVTDVSCNDPRRCFQRSGIAEEASAAGAKVILPEKQGFKEIDFQGKVLNVWPVFAPFLEATKVINMAAAKHHSLTGVTLGMKNWYGIIGGRRSQLHQQINESIVDLADFMRPALTIIDAYRVLIRNGPTGGNLADVVMKNTIIAGTDPVALDAYAAKTYWDLDYHRLPFLKLAHERGLGNMHFSQVRSKVVEI